MFYTKQSASLTVLNHQLDAFLPLVEIKMVDEILDLIGIHEGVEIIKMMVTQQ